MDRSRLAIVALMTLTLISIMVGIATIALNEQQTSYVPEEEGLFSSGRAGIALLKLNGTLTDELPGQDRVSADRVVQQLRQIRFSDNIRGLILEINSPGGTVGASKKIYDAVMLVRKENKPVVAVVTDLAASGGYYVASAADRIYAYPGSLVGSIGVISFHYDISKLLDRYGVNVTTFRTGQYKDSSYPFRPPTGREIEIRKSSQKAAYRQFLRDVADGRGERLSDVERKWGDGRIFSGEQARGEKLIDDYGDRESAAEYIRKTVRAPGELPILKPHRDFWEEMFMMLDDSPLGSRRTPLSGSNLFYLYPDSPFFSLELIQQLAPNPTPNLK